MFVHSVLITYLICEACCSLLLFYSTQNLVLTEKARFWWKTNTILFLFDKTRKVILKIELQIAKEATIIVYSTCHAFVSMMSKSKLTKKRLHRWCSSNTSLRLCETEKRKCRQAASRIYQVVTGGVGNTRRVARSPRKIQIFRTRNSNMELDIDRHSIILLFCICFKVSYLITVTIKQ